MQETNKLSNDDTYLVVRDNGGQALVHTDTFATQKGFAKLATDAAGNTLGIMSAAGNTLPIAATPKTNWLRKAVDLTTWALGNSGTAATAVVDSASPFGVPAIRLDIPNGNTYAQLTSTGLSVPGYNAAPGNLTWVVYIERPDWITQCQSIIGTAGFASSDTVTWNISNSDKHNHSGVHVIGHNKTLAYDVVDVRIRFFGGVPSGQTARAWLLGCYIPEVKKPFVMLTYDDADISFITRTHPNLSARGIKATFGINWADVGTNHGLYVDEADLRAMYDYGHDFASHNLTNTNVDTQGVTAYLADFDACLRQLQSRGWVRGNDYHPVVQGKHNPDLVEGLRSRGARFIRNATTTDLTPIGLTTVSDRACLLPIGIELTNTVSLASAKAKIDEAISYGQDVIVMGHKLAAAAAPVTWAETDHAALLDYLLLKRSQGLIEGVGSLSEWKPLRGVA